MDFSFQALVQKHTSQMESAFRSLVDTIVRSSKLSISLLRISHVTEESFHVSLEARITKTGPASASIAPMTLDLCGPAGQFGKVTLPAITTQAYGTDVVVASQLINIVDKEALKAFIRAIIQGDSVILSLRNGQTSISALGIGPRETSYEKELELPGMNGPVVRVHAASLTQTDPRLAGSPSTASLTSGNAVPLSSSLTSASILSVTAPGNGSPVSITFHVMNPSPLEMSFGTCSFDILDHEDRLLVELKGRLDIRCHYFEATFQGIVNRAVAARLAASIKEAAAPSGSNDEKSGSGRGSSRTPGARLVGRRCAGAGWCDETIKGIDVPIKHMGRLFRVLGMEDAEEEVEDKRGGLTKFAQKLMMR
ncbi:hypothetical protein GGR51DRAFT_552843 [Nemania sp. FL0031]|nr:hypothetical protein GGR51DRAFT_552843 [Nemania sp. FL0031]